MSEFDNPPSIRRLAKEWQLTEQQYQCLVRLQPAAASQLIMIDTTLRQLFASSPLLADLWMTSPNRAFGNVSPMDIIEKEGITGLKRVVEFLCLADGEGA